MATREEIAEALCRQHCRQCGEKLREDSSALGVCYYCMIEDFNRTVNEQLAKLNEQIPSYKDLANVIWPPAKR